MRNKMLGIFVCMLLISVILYPSLKSDIAENKIIEKSHVEGEKLNKTLREKAQNEIELLVAQAKKNIEIDKEDMKQEIKQETAELIVLALEKVMGEKMDAKKDGKFIEDILKDIKK